LPEMDTRPLLAEAEKVRTVGSDLRMRSISRYSTRSRRRMSFHGVEGQIEYEGPLARWLPVLRAAAAVNIGKGATFGFGAMRIEYREG
ncbi:MAG: CRISPR system precrRNA processing endoribonuclease RAMP protein Cas6, partial [Planctomycetota bacterium]|nr:CRISPR system precrRNA processing endoribonuclease RAMP protein Cas6 [Planctomycetota bacterium]